MTTVCSRPDCESRPCDCSDDGFTGGPLRDPKPRRVAVAIVAHDRPAHLINILGCLMNTKQVDLVLVAMNEPSRDVFREVVERQIEECGLAHVDRYAPTRELKTARPSPERWSVGEVRPRKLVAWENEVGFGYAGAVAQLIEVARLSRVDHLLVQTDDVFIDWHSIRALSAELGGLTMVVGPTVLDLDGEVWSCGGQVSRRTGLPSRAPRPGLRIADDGDDVDLVCGCCMMIDMRLFDYCACEACDSYGQDGLVDPWRRWPCSSAKVNWWDESWGFYMEEADFCARVRRAGYAVKVVPSARCRHDVRKAALSDGLKARYFSRNNMRFLRDWSYPRRAKAFAWCFYWFGSFILNVFGRHEAARGLRDGLRDGRRGLTGMIRNAVGKVRDGRR